jgi:hypothetical protein
MELIDLFIRNFNEPLIHGLAVGSLTTWAVMTYTIRQRLKKLGRMDVWNDL